MFSTKTASQGRVFPRPHPEDLPQILVQLSTSYPEAQKLTPKSPVKPVWTTGKTNAKSPMRPRRVITVAADLREEKDSEKLRCPKELRPFQFDICGLKSNCANIR